MIFGATRTFAESPSATEKLAEIRARQDGLVSAVLLASANEHDADPDPVELGAITRALNGAYEGIVEWWETHPDVEPEQLTEWLLALVLPGLRAMADGA